MWDREGSGDSFLVNARIFSQWYAHVLLMLDLRKRGMHYYLDVFSHSVTLNLKTGTRPKQGDALLTGGARITVRIQYIIIIWTHIRAASLKVFMAAWDKAQQEGIQSSVWNFLYEIYIFNDSHSLKIWVCNTCYSSQCWINIWLVSHITILLWEQFHSCHDLSPIHLLAFDLCSYFSVFVHL